MSDQPLPVVPFLKIPEEGTPYLEGHRCGGCQATFLGERSVCSKCGARDQMDTFTLPTRGKLYSYSIVYRSFPGVEVPYISAIVDLEDGTAIKGNLIGVDPDPENITFDMPIEVVFDDALGRRDSEGRAYLAYFFQAQTS